MDESNNLRPKCWFYSPLRLLPPEYSKPEGREGIVWSPGPWEGGREAVGRLLGGRKIRMKEGGKCIRRIETALKER